MHDDVVLSGALRRLLLSEGGYVLLRTYSPDDEELYGHRAGESRLHIDKTINLSPREAEAVRRLVATQEEGSVEALAAGGAECTDAYRPPVPPHLGGS